MKMLLKNGVLMISLTINTVFSITIWTPFDKPYSFDCTTNASSFTSIVWRTRNKTLFLCSGFTMLCEASVNSLLHLYNVTISTDTVTITSTFTIKTVVKEQHGSSWFCIEQKDSGSIYRSIFDLYVSTPPETPFCLYPTLLNDVTIEVKCVTEIVSPEAICLIYIQTNTTEYSKTENGFLTYNTEESRTKGYNKTECTYTVSAGLLGPGSHAFYVEMYSNTTSNITDDMKRTSEKTNSVEIGYPDPVLAPDCQVNDFMKENQIRNCTCHDRTTTFLPTRVKWSGGTAQNGRLVFLAKRPFAGENYYTCSISNKLNWTKEIKYQPKVAYGPFSVTLSIQNVTVDQCDSNRPNISGTCKVSESVPESSVLIYANNAPVTSVFNTTKSDFIFSQVVSTSGTIYVLCRAVNSVFDDISSEMISSVTVKGPPEVPQISSVTGDVKVLSKGNQLQVTEGNTIIVCESKGGYPLYKNISISCGENRKANEKNDSISITLYMSRDMQSINCTCIVWHESKCFHNAITVSLKFIEDEQNNVGPIIGGVIAAVVGVVLIVVLTVFLVRRRSNKLKRKQPEEHVTKMKTYSNTQAKRDSIDYETHQYEEPNITPENYTSSDINTTNYTGQTGISSNFVLGGNIENDNGRKPAEEINSEISSDAGTDTPSDKHPYEEIHDENVSRGT